MGPSPSNIPYASMDLLKGIKCSVNDYLWLPQYRDMQIAFQQSTYNGTGSYTAVRELFSTPRAVCCTKQHGPNNILSFTHLEISSMRK